MSSVGWGVLSSCCLITAGCQVIIGIEDPCGPPDCGTPSDAGPGDDGPPPPDAARPEFSFAVLTVNATIPLDGTNVIDVEVQRRGGFDGEVTVAGMSLPNGLLVEPITIPSGQTMAQVPVGARAPLQLGNIISFDLVATADALPARMTTVTDAEITGKPGSPDNSFGSDGLGTAAIPFGGDDYGGFFDLEVINNGDVLAVGWGFGGLGGSRFALIRLGADGVPDPDFNGGVLVRTGFGPSNGDAAAAYAVGRQSGGRIIAMGGHSGSGLPPDIALARYSPTGAGGDIDFGNFQAGKSRIDLGGDEAALSGLVLPDSRIVVVGESSGQLFIARATTFGELDTSFHAPAGFDIPGLGTYSRAEAVIVDNHGRLLVAGFVQLDDDLDMVVLRYTPDGVLDPAFGDGGVVMLGVPVIMERAVGVAIRGDGRIVVAGTSNVNGNEDFQVRQLMENGAPDPSFGDMGVSTPAMGPGNDVATDMLLLPDGRAVVIGNTVLGDQVVARYTRSGALDPYFGQGGVLNLHVGDYGEILAIEQYSNSKVLIAGGDSGGSPGPGTFGLVLRMWM